MIEKASQAGMDFPPSPCVGFDSHLAYASRKLAGVIERMGNVMEKFGDSVAEELRKGIAGDLAERTAETETYWYENIRETEKRIIRNEAHDAPDWAVRLGVLEELERQKKQTVLEAIQEDGSTNPKDNDDL